MSPKATISQIVLAMFVGVVTRVLALSRFFQKFSGDCSWNPRFVDRLLDALIAHRALIRNARDLITDLSTATDLGVKHESERPEACWLTI